MKKLDGRSKEARAKRARALARQQREHAAVCLAEITNDVTVGGTGLTGKKYVPLDLDNPPVTAFSTQVGGNHYTKLAIQPMEYSFKNKLDPAQHTAIKYITRFRDKGGKRDLEAAKHVIDMLMELEYGVGGA